MKNIKREDMELEMCYRIASDITHADVYHTDAVLNDAFRTNWYYLYYKIIKLGWDALSDAEVETLYSWFVNFETEAQNV